LEIAALQDVAGGFDNSFVVEYEGEKKREEEEG